MVILWHVSSLIDIITGFLQVLMWILAMLCGMVLGKLLIHGYLCGKLLRLKMFRDDQVPQRKIS